MGKLHSKQVRCVLVDKDIQPVLDKGVHKYNISCRSVEELLMSCYESNKDVALNVDIPPEKCMADNKTINLLTLDKEMTYSDTTTDNNKSQNKLSFQELECGICVECSENSKQEWTFTLYDFDGQGKVTKEDLATLLKALYDAVGSSLKLPSNSTKSLKLRLSVGSDESSCENKMDGKNPAAMTQSLSKSARHSTTTKKVEPKFQKINNLADTSVKFPKSNIEKQEQEMVVEKDLTVEHQHLAELVHENMLRNRVDHDRLHSKKKHTSRRRIKTSSFTYRQLKENCGDTGAKESQARRNYYLDLAGIENSCLNQPIAEGIVAEGVVAEGVVAEGVIVDGNNKETCTNILRDSTGVSFHRSCGAGGCRYSVIAHSRNKTSNTLVPMQGASKQCCVVDDSRHATRSLCQTENTKNGGRGHCEADDAKNGGRIVENAHNGGKTHIGGVDGSGRAHSHTDHLQNLCVINAKMNVAPSFANGNLPSNAESRLVEHSGSVSPKRSHHKVPDTGLVEISSPKTKIRNPRAPSIASNVATNGSANHHKRHRQRDADNSFAMKQVAEWIEKEYSHDLGQHRCLKRHEHHHIHHHHHYYHHYHVT